MDNDKVEQVLPQYAKMVLQTKDLEEWAFITETIYQTNREHKIEHNIPLIMTVGTEIWQVDKVIVL
jgi:hypothetical protein